MMDSSGRNIYSRKYFISLIIKIITLYGIILFHALVGCNGEDVYKNLLSVWDLSLKFFYL
jgi:hypothetical protein